MQIKGSRFLTIGGAGFIGSHLVDQLLDQAIKGTFNVLEACVAANSIGFQANINLESGLNELLEWKRSV